MLSEREHRVLREIEHRVAETDPRFAASMRRSISARRRRAALPYDAVVVVAVLSAVLCLELSVNGAAVVAAVLAVVMFFLRPRRRPARTDRWLLQCRRTWES
ncbi:MAG: hypothetical protein V7633_3559 [Pseudonocardia sp.]|jgi:hypothetical protein